ncbi:MAG TPA: DddA-like double-stranded DNA deaminase toxin [Xanthobacteraceae bacterium]|nr:DddA-like double-stranded DNA deaminase toxin [Xanthobacteraceae bacterium]
MTVPNSNFFAAWNDPGLRPASVQRKPDPFAAYFSMIPASSLARLAGAPPIFADSFGKIPQPTPLELPLEIGSGGIYGSIAKMLAERQAAANDPWAAARNSIVGSFADPPLTADGLPENFGQGGIVGSLRNLPPSNASRQGGSGYFDDSHPFLLPTADNYQDQDPSSLVRPVANKAGEEQHKWLEQQLEMFDQRAFGTGHQLGGTEPFLIPAPGRNNRPPSAPQAAPPGPQAQAGSPGASPVAPSPSPAAVSGAAGLGAPRAASVAPPSSKPAGTAAATTTAIAPPGRFSPQAPPMFKWPPSTDGIQMALATGSGLPEAVSAVLPKFDGKNTYGILITDEGDVVPLKNGNPSPLYRTYSSAGHVEGQAAIWMREHGSTGGVLYQNNTGGTCGRCNGQINTLLPEESLLSVFSPEGSMPKNAWARVNPPPYKGTSQMPIQSPPSNQLDIFDGEQQ